MQSLCTFLRARIRADQGNSAVALRSRDVLRSYLWDVSDPAWHQRAEGRDRF